MDHLIHDATFLNMTGPAGDRHDTRATFIERALAVAIGTIVGGEHDLRHIGDRTCKHWMRVPPLSLWNTISVLLSIFFSREPHDSPDLIVHRRGTRSIGPAARILDILVLVEIFLRGLVGRVHGVEGEIEEERRRPDRAVDELDRVVAERRSGITLLLDKLIIAVPVRPCRATCGVK